MERFQKLLENHHQYAKDWKVKTGGKVIGYLCTYFPEELAYAAGVLPIRILGSHEAEDITERYMYGAFCPLSRDILAQGLSGRYDYLDGVGFSEGCQHLMHAFNIWRLHVPTPYFRHVYTPAYVESPRATSVLHGDLAFYRRALEEWTGNTITDEALDRTITVYNTNRQLMRQVYELRRGDNPLVSGTEAMEMVLSSQIMDKEEHNRLLMEVIDNLPQRKDRGNPGVRLMLLGSDTSDTELVRLIESLGATVVIDEHCSGSRYFWNQVIPQEDRLLAIAHRYLDKPRCPLKDTRFRRRIAHISQMAEDYNVKGAIVVLQKFCHGHQYDTSPITSALKQRYIPTHIVELDTTIPVGEFKTRIEAFLDTFHPTDMRVLA